MTGLASTHLEQDLRTELRRHGIVLWLDRDDAYTPFVDALAARQATGDFPHPVVSFRGSFLELMIALERFGSGLESPPLLIHVPGFNKDTIRQTPLLELYEPGHKYLKALDTLVREAATARVAPGDVETFLATKPTLEQADTWLDAAVSQSAFGLAAALAEVGPSMIIEALGRPDSKLAIRVTNVDDAKILRVYLHKLTGLDDAWIAFFGENEGGRPLDHALDALAAWLLCVEYVNDLRRPAHLEPLRRLRELSAPLVAQCREIVEELRRTNGDAYARRANEVEGLLAAELAAMKPEDLGEIDTFREEENRVLQGAVEALLASDWATAKAWCEARQGEKSFWLQRDRSHRFAWTLIGEAAELGATIAACPAPLAGATTLEAATERYASTAFAVDRAHRRFEQKRLALLDSSLPHFGPLREVATALRILHRAWADEIARTFNRLCKHVGFLPEASLQQRTLFEQVVLPLTQTGEKVAVFMVDAFRFEMASELLDDLRAGGAVVDLKPRLAELPSITSVGMNVLAPVSHGADPSSQGERLTVSKEFLGFKAGEFTVRSPADRARAMGVRALGKPAHLVKLSAVCESSTASLTKEIKAHGLVVVHSKEIDDAGEANVGIPTFESTLRQLRAAWHHLQLAGVKHFVFTADHGFLIQDETTAVKPFGSKHDPQRRHVFDPHPREEAGMVNVSVSALGYQGELMQGYLLFREDTAVFATGAVGATFVHGGNSPQERIIPVLTVTKKRAASASLGELAIEVEALPDAVGLHRLRWRVRFAEWTSTSLGFIAIRPVGVELRVPASPEIRVVVKDVTAPGVLEMGRVQLPVGDEWAEIFFSLEGPADDLVRVEAYHPDNLEKVKSASPDQWFSVSGGASPRAATTPPAIAPPAPVGWAEQLLDEGARRVFLHIEKHGIMTEQEITVVVGSPRAFRKFSLEFEANLARLPFRVRIEAGDGGKRYLKEGDQ